MVEIEQTLNSPTAQDPQRIRDSLNTVWEKSPDTIKTCVTWVNSNVTQPVLTKFGVQDVVVEQSDSLLKKADATLSSCENHVVRGVEGIKNITRSQIDFWLPDWEQAKADAEDVDAGQCAADQINQDEPLFGVVKDRVRQRVTHGVDTVLPESRREQIYQHLLSNGLDRVLHAVESVTANTEKTMAHVSHEVSEVQNRARERLVSITEKVKETIAPYRQRATKAKDDVSAELKFRWHPVRVHGEMAGREIFKLMAASNALRVPERLCKLLLFTSGLRETDPDFQIAVDQVGELFSAGIAFFRLSASIPSESSDDTAGSPAHASSESSQKTPMSPDSDEDALTDLRQTCDASSDSD